MKYLRTFESHDQIESDITDILIEIKDEYPWTYKVWKETKGKYFTLRYVAVIELEGEIDESGINYNGYLLPKTSIDCIEHVIDYMKSNGVSKYTIGFGDDDEFSDDETIDTIKQLPIWSNNYIRIDFIY